MSLLISGIAACGVLGLCYGVNKDKEDQAFNSRFGMFDILDSKTAVNKYLDNGELTIKVTGLNVIVLTYYRQGRIVSDTITTNYPINNVKTLITNGTIDTFIGYLIDRMGDTYPETRPKFPHMRHGLPRGEVPTLKNYK